MRRAGALAALTLGLAASAGAALAGMRPLSEETNPNAARAASSVVRIVSFANPGQAAPQKVATESLPRLNLKGLTYPLSPGDRAAFQGEVCRLNGLAWCPVFKQESRGTAFSVGQSGQFMTCRHVFQDWLHYAGRFNGIDGDDLIPPFALANAANRLLFVSAAPSASGFRMTLMARHPDLQRPVASLMRSQMFWDADFVEFQLPDGLGLKPLPRRTSFDASESVIVIGYPDIAADPNDAPLVSSAGRITERDDIGIVTNVASAKGMSGAPILDAMGRAGGMACAIGRREARGARPALGLPIDPAELREELGAKYGATLEANKQ